jgi:hypothetical protein
MTSFQHRMSRIAATTGAMAASSLSAAAAFASQRPGHRQRLHAAGDGGLGLWAIGCDHRRRPDRRRAPALRLR